MYNIYTFKIISSFFSYKKKGRKKRNLEISLEICKGTKSCMYPLTICIRLYFSWKCWRIKYWIVTSWHRVFERKKYAHMFLTWSKYPRLNAASSHEFFISNIQGYSRTKWPPYLPDIKTSWNISSLLLDGDWVRILTKRAHTKEIAFLDR